MAFESFKPFFGDDKENTKPEYNKESKEQTPESHVLTGRESVHMSDDVSTRQERGAASPEEREQNVVQGIEEIMNAFGIHETELLGQEEFFVKELQKRGVLTARDMQFNAEGLVADVLKALSRKEA